MTMKHKKNKIITADVIGENENTVGAKRQIQLLDAFSNSHRCMITIIIIKRVDEVIIPARGTRIPLKCDGIGMSDKVPMEST